MYCIKCSQFWGTILGSHNKDNGILGSTLGSPYLLKQFAVLHGPSVSEILAHAFPQRVHVAIEYILRAQRGFHTVSLGPMYLL